MWMSLFTFHMFDCCTNSLSHGSKTLMCSSHVVGCVSVAVACMINISLHLQKSLSFKIVVGIVSPGSDDVVLARILEKSLALNEVLVSHLLGCHSILNSCQALSVCCHIG